MNILFAIILLMITTGLGYLTVEVLQDTTSDFKKIFILLLFAAGFTLLLMIYMEASLCILTL